MRTHIHRLCSLCLLGVCLWDGVENKVVRCTLPGTALADAATEWFCQLCELATAPVRPEQKEEAAMADDGKPAQLQAMKSGPRVLASEGRRRRMAQKVAGWSKARRERYYARSLAATTKYGVPERTEDLKRMVLQIQGAQPRPTNRPRPWTAQWAAQLAEASKTRWAREYLRKEQGHESGLGNGRNGTGMRPKAELKEQPAGDMFDKLVRLGAEKRDWTLIDAAIQLKGGV